MQKTELERILLILRSEKVGGYSIPTDFIAAFIAAISKGFVQLDAMFIVYKIEEFVVILNLSCDVQ